MPSKSAIRISYAACAVEEASIAANTNTQTVRLFIAQSFLSPAARVVVRVRPVRAAGDRIIILAAHVVRVHPGHLVVSAGVQPAGGGGCDSGITVGLVPAG
ncbi:MAG: hypothetical protein WBF17_08385 [Phycisphaerae bacterium]